MCATRSVAYENPFGRVFHSSPSTGSVKVTARHYIDTCYTMEAMILFEKKAKRVFPHLL